MAKRVALYLRVSTKNGQTVDNQRQALTEAIGRRQGWVIVDEFADEGVSGAKGRDRRPEFDRLLKQVVRGKIDVVAPWSVDRLGRSLQDLVGFLGELNAAGCDIYLEKQAVDTTTPAHAGLSRAREKATKSGKPIGRARDRPNERGGDPRNAGERQRHSQDRSRIQNRH
jgi:hypothetical protein